MEASQEVLVPTEASQGVPGQMEASREALVPTEAHQVSFHYPLLRFGVL